MLSKEDKKTTLKSMFLMEKIFYWLL